MHLSGESQDRQYERQGLGTPLSIQPTNDTSRVKQNPL